MENPFDTRQRAASLDLVRASLQDQRPLRLRVISSSMLPTLRPEDVVVVHAAPFESLRRGDLVVVQHGLELITHRLVSLDAGAWRTKGDNCADADPVWPAAHIVGRVSAIERAGKTIDLQNNRWQTLNRRLGRLNGLQVSLYQRGRAIKVKVFGPRSRPWLSTLARLSAVPFRVLIRWWVLLAAR